MPITNHPISLLRTLTPSELLSVATGLGHHGIQFSATPSETCSWQLLSRTWLLASGRGTQEPSPIRTINHMEVEGCYTVLATKPLNSCPEILLAAGDAREIVAAASSSLSIDVLGSCLAGVGSDAP